MAKNKLKKFSEMSQFKNVVQPENYFLREDISLKSNWNSKFFKNNNPIVLELGCGKGEYTFELAQRYPQKNFIGVDIKGSRMWAGASAALDENISNIGFLRIMIENIEYCFGADEIDEIWITFPDPQIKRKRESKRLIHSNFLRKYSKILKREGAVNLKTDSKFLYGYCLGILEGEGHEVIDSTHNVHDSQKTRRDVDITTYYERIFLKKDEEISYIKFRINY